MPAKKRVLVTGLAGFTGRYLMQELEAQGHEVFGLSREGGVQCDLTDPEATRASVAAVAPGVVVHLAAQSFAGPAALTETYLTNILGTRNLFTAAAEAGVGRVILASSGAVYGAGDGTTVIDEAAPLAPGNDYAVSKAASEMFAPIWPQLDTVIVRPFNYTGRGQDTKFLVPKIVAAYAERRASLELGNLDVARDFSDVRAVAAAYAQLVTLSEPPRVVNLCSGTSRSLGEILDICAGLTGHRPKIVSKAQFQRSNDPARVFASNALLRSVLPDWEPIPLESTLAWMLGR